MFTDGVGDDFTIASHGVHFNFLGMLHETADHDGMFLADIGSESEETFQLVLVGADVHGSTGEHVGRTHQHGEANAVNELLNVVHAGQRAPLRLVHTDAAEHGRELLAVFGIVNVACGSAEQVYLGGIETKGEVIGNLTAGGDNHAMGRLKVKDVHDALKGEFVKVEAVADVIVRRNRFGIIVNHDGTVAFLANCVESLHTAPVKFHGGTNAIGTASEDDDRAVVVLKLNVVGDATISHIEIIGERRIFCCQRINLFDDRKNALLLAMFSHGCRGFFDVHVFFHADGAGDLEIGEALHLGATQQFVVKCFKRRTPVKFTVRLMNLL